MRWQIAEVNITLGNYNLLKLFSPDREDVAFSLAEVLKTPSIDFII